MAEVVLVTGANGEVGNALIPALFKSKKYFVVALDIHELSDELKPFVHEAVVSDILDNKVIESILGEHEISAIFHLAGRLSTVAEKDPELAHDVNVNGTFNLLSAANKRAMQTGKNVKFIFPSTIAVYGMPDLDTKTKTGKVKETEYNNPNLIYGINKLYCEAIGKYFSTNYSLTNKNIKRLVDFRCLRFPGLISAFTLPTGGTSDYGAEMIHSAAQGKGYESFVRPDSTLPFMVMPDAIKSLMMLTETPREKLTRQVYNVTSFSVTADNIAQMVNNIFPDSSISYTPDEDRQKIVDSWPADIDDSAARKDWGWSPEYDFDKSFRDYLIPEIQNKYKSAV